jgi:membrane-bound lytic murein transglycosylase B
MGRLGFIVITAALLGSNVQGADSTTVTRESVYNRVLSYLKNDNIPESFVAAAFNRPEVKYRKAVIRRFKSPNEQKPYSQYKRIFLTHRRIHGGVKFYQSHQTMIDSIAEYFGVDPLILTSMVGIESNYGDYHAEFSVFNALYSVSIGFPPRSDWAMKELAEFLKFCYNNKMDPQSIRGSYAGAFGYGQFIPSSFNRYAVDMDGDGIREYLQWPDVLGSIANYLKENGYPENSSDFSNGSGVYRALYSYNHSDNYVRVVLDLRKAIRAKLR